MFQLSSLLSKEVHWFSQQDQLQKKKILDWEIKLPKVSLFFSQ